MTLKKHMSPGIKKWGADIGVQVQQITDTAKFEEYLHSKNTRLADLLKPIEDFMVPDDLDMEAKSYAVAILFQKAHEMALDILGYLDPTHGELLQYKSGLDAIRWLTDQYVNIHLAFAAENGVRYATVAEERSDIRVN